MKIGLIGLPLTGKTTIFQLMTKEFALEEHNKTEANIGTAIVPDERLDYLSKAYNSKKTIYASIEITDIQGIQPSSPDNKSTSLHFLEAVRQVDALVNVIRVFENDEVFHIDESIDPIRDIETVNLELLFADLAVMENRINRIESNKKLLKENQKELDLIKRCKSFLEEGQLIYNMDLNDEERQMLKNYNFLTERPMILLINMDEDQFINMDYPNRDRVKEYAEEMNIPLMEICAQIELEIDELDEDDKKMFMEDMNIEEPGLNKLAKACYSLLNLVSFITAGPGQIKAWPIRRDTIAKKAGGTIHSDIERGFIRAEVAKFSDFQKHGSMNNLKEKGLVKLEGKESIIEDGDIINFRFNV